MKKELTLEAKIKAIMHKYYFDVYSKNRYIDDCTRDIIVLITQEGLDEVNLMPKVKP